MSIVLGLAVAAPGFSDQAQVLLQKGECAKAIDLLEPQADKTDEQRRTLGMAYLCLAKVESKDIAQARLAPGVAGLGVLANKLLPVQADRLRFLDQAGTEFGLISVEKERRELQDMVRYARAATILAGASSDNAHLVRSDLSPASCLGVRCDEEPLTCEEKNLKDPEALSILTELSDVTGFDETILIPSHLRCELVNKALSE